MANSNVFSFQDKVIIDQFNSDLVIINQNIRSLKSNFDEFVLLLENMNRKLDVIILTEIWIDDSEVSQYSVSNYTYSKCPV